MSLILRAVTHFKKFRNTVSLDETEWKMFSVIGNNLREKRSVPQTKPTLCVKYLTCESSKCHLQLSPHFKVSHDKGVNSTLD